MPPNSMDEDFGTYRAHQRVSDGVIELGTQNLQLRPRILYSSPTGSVSVVGPAPERSNVMMFSLGAAGDVCAGVSRGMPVIRPGCHATTPRYYGMDITAARRLLRSGHRPSLGAEVLDLERSSLVAVRSSQE